MTDGGLLRSVCRRDGKSEKAIADIIDRYNGYVCTVIKSIIGGYMTDEDIEEVSSDVFLSLWNNADKPEAGKLKPWLGAVARNSAKNKLRELTGVLPLEDDYINYTADTAYSPADIVIKNEEASLINRAVNEMKSIDREIFLRHYYGLQSVISIAESMGMSESAVKLRLMRGREKLKNALEKGGYVNEKEHLRFT